MQIVRHHDFGVSAAFATSISGITRRCLAITSASVIGHDDSVSGIRQGIDDMSPLVPCFRKAARVLNQ